MRSFKFPIMFNTNSSNIWKSTEYKEATRQNARLVLSSERNSLIGDPFWGGLIDPLMFDQNSPMTLEIFTDIIYEQLAIFIPQLRIRREDINVTQKNGKIIAEVHGINQIDFTNDTYKLVLATNSDNNNN